MSEIDPQAPMGDINSGLFAIARLLAMHRIAVDPAQLRHGLGHQEEVSARDLVRIAQGLDGVRAKVRSANWNDLERLPLPALANGGQGWFIIGRVAGEEALVQRSGAGIAKMARAEVEEIWDGELVLVTTRENVGLVARAFDFTWFIPQIIRYRHLIGEVLLSRWR